MALRESYGGFRKYKSHLKRVVGIAQQTFSRWLLMPEPYESLPLLAVLSGIFSLNRGFYHANEGFFVYHQAYYGAINLRDAADNAGIGDYFHAFFQTFNEFLLLFLAFYLRPDEEEVKHDDDEKGEQHSDQSAAAGVVGL